MNKELIKQAEIFANNKHRLSFRKDGFTPYIEHPKEVVKKIMDWNYKSYFLEKESKFFNNLDNLICVGWLHDTIEKTNTKIEEIFELFGSDIAYMVKEISFDEKNETFEDYFKRNQYNIIKLADHICNTMFFKKNNLIDYKEYFHNGDILVNNFINYNFCKEDFIMIKI